MLAGGAAGSTQQPSAAGEKNMAEIGTFSSQTLQENSAVCPLISHAVGIGFQVAFPYMIIYINNFIGVSKTEYAIVGGAVIIGSAIAAIPLKS